MENILTHQEIEYKIYQDMIKYRSVALIEANNFKLNPKILFSILYVEKIQEDLDEYLTWMRNIKCNLVSNERAGQLFSVILGWIGCTMGYAHILPDTAREAIRILKNTKEYAIFVSYEDIKEYMNDVNVSIRLMAAILRAIIIYWDKVNISNNPAILATLYNIIDFKKCMPIPHNKPKSGGVCLSSIIDGEYIKSMSFGDRVQKVYTSNTLDMFMKGFL